MFASRGLALLFLAPILMAAGTAGAQAPADAAADRALRHTSDAWLAMEPHLPNPVTGSPALLMQAADVLRARRLPEDALEFYGYALQRGGDEATLRNDLGVTLLELRRYDEARASFKRCLQLRPRDAQAWNNLGATEYVSGRFRTALDDYSHAVKLNKKVAVFHANLGTAYIEFKDYESARSQFGKALQLDPEVFHSGGFAGVEAHVLSSTDHGRFCFEMARLAAAQHQDEDVLRWLARSVESGFDVVEQIGADHDLNVYAKDARFLTILANAKAIRARQVAESGVAPLPPGTAR